MKVYPAEDGIFRLDRETGEQELIISHSDMAGFLPASGAKPDDMRYFTPPLFNENGTRFMFWYRSRCGLHNGIYTASADGSGIYKLPTLGNSHSVWLGNDRILAWAAVEGRGTHNFLFHDRKPFQEPSRVCGASFEFNGHATFSPDTAWLITDTPEPPVADKRNQRTLYLFQCKTHRRIELGTFGAPDILRGPLRCDLHPRWDRTGGRVCFDSAHDGCRQMYLLDTDAFRT